MSKRKPIVPVSAVDVDALAGTHGRLPTVPAVPLMPRRAQIASDAEYRRLWSETRRDHLGASEMGIVMGVSTWSSPFALWWAKKGGWDIDQTEDMEWGHRLEPAVAQRFQDEHPDSPVVAPDPALFGHPAHPWLSCTPDRLVLDTPLDGSPPRWVPLELKTDEGGPGWGAWGTDEVPPAYRIQVIVQCAILGAPFGCLARLGRKSKGRKYTEYLIPYTVAEFATIAAAGEKFWLSIEQDVEPEVDGHYATTDALKRLHENVLHNEAAEVDANLVAEWRAARQRRTQINQEVRHLDNLVRKALGNAAFGMDPDGNTFVKRTLVKRAGYEVPPTTVDRLDWRS